MSLRPRWKEPTGGVMRWGFDDTATPLWFMVGERVSTTLLLDFAQGKLVKSLNPHIVEVTDMGMEGQSRIINFEGKIIGPTTRVEVRDPKTNGLESVVEVSVKRRLDIGLSFHFVYGYDSKTVHGPGIVQDLIESLNQIYTLQANINFASLRAAPLELDYVSGDIVREEKDIVDNAKTGFSRLDHEWWWDKIFTKNAENGFNLYFVPVNSKTDRSKNDTLIFTKGDNCVIEDGKQPPIYTLAHAIGRMLGCPFTSDKNQMNHLMFWDPKLGKDFFSRSDDFIPKHTANIMNP